MTTTHTPGNWVFEDKGDRFEILSGRNVGYDWIATVNGGCEHDEANARLIAQAPALLEALKRMIDTAEVYWTDRGSNTVWPALENARATFAAATS